jgi:hypothetical protein
MTEKELRDRFEDLTLPPETFSHHEHVRLAWTYLCDLPLIDALRAFPANLKRFAASIGKPDVYHETVTWTWLMVIADRIERCGERRSWSRFLAANDDLLTKDFLSRYYDKATLDSPQARRRFVLPER